MKLKFFLWTGFAVFFLFSCQKEAKQALQSRTAVNLRTVIVEDVAQTSSYTYLKVKEDDQTYWMAVSKGEIQTGDTLYFSGALEMKNFVSKELKKTFDKIYFVQDIGKTPIAAIHHLPVPTSHGRNISVPKEGIAIAPLSDGISIAALYAKRENYANKFIKVRGQVTKFNANILGRNWVHIQDGTSDSGNYEVTITTADQATMGEMVTFEGKVALNKDFGAGYFYELIVEDGKKLDESK